MIYIYRKHPGANGDVFIGKETKAARVHSRQLVYSFYFQSHIHVEDSKPPKDPMSTYRYDISVSRMNESLEIQIAWCIF
jgi:hypothetical protein